MYCKEINNDSSQYGQLKKCSGSNINVTKIK
jgi:hypothetical protein